MAIELTASEFVFLPRRIALALAAGLAVAAAHAAPPPGYALNLAIYDAAANHVYAYADLGTRTWAVDGVLGAPGDVAVAGDFDGNGVADIGVYRSGTWYLDLNHDLTTLTMLTFGGNAGDVPLAGDVDGDGKADLVIYRAGTWLIRQSSNGQTLQRTLGGAAGDQPVVADFDGDGIADLAVFRAGTWLVQTHSTAGADLVDHFGGAPGDRACAADWNQDGRADLCVYRDGIWLFKSLGGAFLDAYAFGGPNDTPLPGAVFNAAGAIYVKAGASGTQDGTLAHPYAKIGSAFDAAVDGSVIRVGVGTYTDAIAFYGPQTNYAPGKFGKNNIKLIGASRRGVKLLPGSGDAITLWGATGYVLRELGLGSTDSRALVLIGGAGSVAPTLPGASATLALSTVSETANYGILVTGTGSHADILYDTISRSKTKSGIGLQSGAPSATVVGCEIMQNGYTLGAGVDGNGIEGQQTSTMTITGNSIHDNNRFGIIGVTDSHLTIDANTVTANQLNGILLCGASANDTSTAQITGNYIAGNGVSLQNGQGYNGLEFFLTCTGSQTVSGNTFSGNSLNGMFIGSGGATVTGNVFSGNGIGITEYVDSTSSSNTTMTATGNSFMDNLTDGIFVQRVSGSTRTVSASVGGVGAGQANSFTGSGYHGIGCTGSPLSVTCPAGGNTFSANTDDIEATCPASCTK